MDTEVVEIPTLVAPSNNRRRGRPKKEDAPIRQLSIRIFPCDGEAIDFAKFITTEDFIKFIAGAEISKDKGKLHYHIYAETRRSDTYLRTLIYKMARWTPHYNDGNAVYGMKDAHSNTQGYLVKDEDVAFTLGFTPQELEALIDKSAQYRRDLEANKKRRTRKTQNTMKKFVEEAIDAQLEDPRSVVKFILDKYQEHGVPFPSKSQMENAVMRVKYHNSPNYVIDHYCRHL